MIVVKVLKSQLKMANGNKRIQERFQGQFLKSQANFQIVFQEHMRSVEIEPESFGK